MNKEMKVLCVALAFVMSVTTLSSCSVFSNRYDSRYNYSRDYYDSTGEYRRGSFTDAYGNYYAGGYYDRYGNFYADDYYDYDYDYYVGYFDPDGYYHDNYY